MSKHFCNICDPKKKYNNCICNESWKDFNNILQKIENIQSDKIIQMLSISTMTICCDFCSKININKLLTIYSYSIKKSDFYNSALMNWHSKYQYPMQMSIKFFPNGKVQIAGCKTIMAAAYIIRKIYNRLSKNQIFLDTPSINNPYIAMINSDFKLNKNLYLENFCKILYEKNIHNNGNFLSIVYQPIKYPAINTKFIVNSEINSYFKIIYDKSKKEKIKIDKITILFFRSGSIIITGGKDLKKYLEIYTYLLDFI